MQPTIRVYYYASTGLVDSGEELAEQVDMVPVFYDPDITSADWAGTMEEFVAAFTSSLRPVWDGAAVVEGASEAEILAEAKSEKDAELTADAYAAFDAIFKDGFRDLAYAIAVNEQTRIKQGKDVMQKLKDLRAQVTGAKTVAEVEAVKWTA